MALRTVDASRMLARNFGTCLSFPGNAGSISLGTANPFGSSSFYFATWVKWAGLNGGFQTLFAKRDSYASNGLMFSAALDSTTGGFNVDTVTSFVPFGYLFPQGKWTHMVWVHDVTNFSDKLYINGELYSSQGIGTLGTKTDALIMVGANQATSQDWFNGKLDEVVIGTGLPTAEDVFALYAKGTNPGTVWTYLKLNEGSGTSATDSSGNGNTGTIAGATYSTDPVIANRSVATNRFIIPSGTQKSLAFDGSSAFATSPIAPDINGLSFGLWFKFNNTDQDHGIVNWESTFDRNGINFRLNNSGKVLALVGSNGSGVVFVLTSSKPLSAGIWYHLVVTYNASKQARVYINAVQDLLGSGTITTNGTSLTIGRRSFTASMHANGFAKNFTYQNTGTDWTSQQISDLYYRNIIPSGATQWQFNDVATDTNGGNALTLSSTTYSVEVPIKSRGIV